MKLLKSLNLPADNGIILTYNLDLLFFEYMLFQALYASGCRNTMILCDPVQSNLALQHDVARLQHVGQRYLLLPARTSPNGAFHPKLILLTSADTGSLYLLSGNLTKSGYLYNWEVLTLFEYNTKKPDFVAWQACKWAFDTLSQIVKVSDIGSLGQERLDQLWGTTPWLHQEPPMPVKDPTVWPLHNLVDPLLKQMLTKYRQEDGSPVNELVIVSPFFDTGARAIEQLLKELQPRHLQLYTQGNQHGLNPTALQTVLARHQLEFQANELYLGSRRLHAKTLLFRTEGGVWLATGSANLSRSAWLHRATTGNTEMVSLRFEPNRTYFDTWLKELTDQATPIELGEIEPSNAESPAKESENHFDLLSAVVDQHELELHMSVLLPPDSVLTLILSGEEMMQRDFEQWSQLDDRSIILPLDPDWLPRLARPLLVQLEIQTTSGQLVSTPVLLHNKTALERSRHPVNRRERPPIPKGMQPESYHHCVDLLEMIEDLLATNQEQLHRHRGAIPATAKKRDKEEEQQAIEEDEYDPDAHFVDEEIRHQTLTSGGDLYANFHDRLTYEELLRAVLAAVYHPTAEQNSESGGDDSSAVTYVFTQTPMLQPDDETLKKRMLARIEHGFRRLISNFLQGTANSDYLAEVPAGYLVELYVIITSYLRVVWRDTMLKDDLFIMHSIDLMNAFWGQPGESGAWETVRSGLADEDLSRLDEKLALQAQTWLHTYVVVNLLDQDRYARLYQIAAWMRHLKSVLGPAEVLETLSQETYDHIWRFSQPNSATSIPASEVVAYLKNVSKIYDEETLKSEIQTWPNTKASIHIGPIGGLSQVPMLRVRRPLAEIELDLFLETFQLFLRWPAPKQRAWARFENTDPLESDDDVKSVVIFYRDDDHSLICDVVRKSGNPRPSLTLENVTAEDLQVFQSLAELEAFTE